MNGWIEMFRALGDSLLEVLRAEATVLSKDLSRSGRHLLVALGLLAGALGLLFWLCGLLITLLVAVLNIWLTLWASVLIVLLLFTAVAGLLAGLGLRRLRQVESPVESVRRRMDDHLDWWRNHLLRDTPAVDVAASAVTMLDDTDEEELP